MRRRREGCVPHGPAIPVAANYPVPRASLRRKLWRDATGRTGYKLLGQQLRGLRSPDVASRRVQYKIWAVQAVMLATPHSMHTGKIADDAKSGKHVFCEKPLALSRNDAEASVAV